jgi:hypothetical protein
MPMRMTRHWMLPFLVLGLAALLMGCARIGGPGGSTSEKAVPCAGSVLADAPTPTVILRNSDTNHAASVLLGAVVEVQMDAQHTWQLDSVTPAGVLTPVGPQGVVQKSACVWDFRVTGAGEATISLVGGALCAPNQPCPMYAILAKFTIHAA